MRDDLDQIPTDEAKAELAQKVIEAKQEMANEELRDWHLKRGLMALSPGEEVKPVEWLCHETLTFESSSLFSGKAKAGKSSMIQALAIGMASGKGAVKSLDGGWLFDSKGKRIKTLYIDTENNRSLVNRRLSSLAKEIDEDLAELISSGFLHVICLEASHAAPFIKHEERESIEDDVSESESYGELVKNNGIQLIICDVMSHCYQQEDSDRDELSQGYMRDFFKIINKLKETSGAHVLLVHHHKKGSGGGNEQASGSSQMLRTPETLCTLSKVAEELNPEGDLFTLFIEGRQLPRERLKWLKARSSKDGGCRVFDEVLEPVKEKKARGAPETAEKLAREILHGVLLKSPELKDNLITPAEWVEQVNRINKITTEWQKSDKTLKDYLRKTLVESGNVQRVNEGVYRILSL